MIRAARANPERICVLMKALFRRNTLCISRKRDEIRAQRIRDATKAVEPECFRQKKKQPLTVTRPIFHTVKGYFSVFLVSSILVTSLSADFLLLCRSRDSQSASSCGVSSPSSKVRHAFGRRSRWRIPSSVLRFPFLGSFLYVTDLHPLWL